MSINVVILEGRLVRDAEISTTKNGTPVTKMRIAHNKWNKKEQKEDPKFFNVKVFKEKPFRQGTLVFLKGELDQFEYSKDDGSKQSYTYVIAYDIYEFNPSVNKSTVAKAKEVFSDDDIPF